MGTLKHIGWRLLNMAPLVVIVSVLTFLVGRLSPGDPIRNQYAREYSAEQIEKLRAAHGIDLPIWEQYLKWVGDLFTAGGGQSIIQNQGVFDILWPAFLNTLILIAGGVTVCLVFGVLIGIVAGLNHGRFLDRFSMLWVQVGSNLSVYWFGLILIWIFALKLQWLPVSGMESRNGGGGFVDLLRHLVLPSVTAGLLSMLILARFTRLGVIEQLQTDHARTFASQGLPRRRLVFKHVGRNVLPSIVNITGLEIGTLITGAVFVESVFNWPGISTQLVNAVNGQDYPLIQGGIVLVAVCYLLVNLATDVIVDVLNPRSGRA